MFEAFDKLPYQGWKDQVEKELKGKDFQEFLSWDFENLHIPAYLTSECISDEEKQLGKQTSLLIENKRPSNGWGASQQIVVNNEAKANEEALIHLSTGVDTLFFFIHSSSTNWKALFANIQTEILSIHLVLDWSVFDEVLTAIPSDYALQIWANPCSALLNSGKALDSSKLDALCANSNQVGVWIDASDIKNGGGTVSQELEFNLNTGLFFAHIAKEKNAALSYQFQFALTPNYFVEVAKLRAFTWLWNALASQEISNPWTATHLSTVGSTLFNAVVDEQNNTLRSSTTALSAILGGSTSHTVLPHDSSYKELSFFSARIANNIHHLLKEEAFMNENTDPVNGSYYIERIAYSIVQNILKAGVSEHFVANLVAGSFQAEVAQKGEEIRQHLADGTIPFLGVNLYPNPEDPNIGKEPKSNTKQEGIAPLVFTH